MNNKMIKYVLFLMLILFIHCKSHQKFNETKKVNVKLKEKQVLKNHSESYPFYKSLSSNILITIKKDDEQKSFPFTLRMKPQEIIWLSAPLGIAKLNLTPQKASFYNKLDKTFFDGDYKIIENFLGIKLNYFSLEKMLLGQMFLEEKHWNYSASLDGYFFVSNKENEQIEILLSDSFRVKKIIYQTKDIYLLVEYNYNFIDNQYFPNEMNIELFQLQRVQKTKIRILFEDIQLNKDLKMPYKLPSGYNYLMFN